MKKVFLTFVFIMFLISLFGNEKEDTVKHRIYNINIALGNTNGGSIGIGKIHNFEKSTKEITANFQYKQNNDYFVTGIYGQIKSFKNKDRKGFFTLLTAGVDYTKGEERPFIFPGVIGGPNEGDYDKQKFAGICPNMTIGCGFSIKLSQKKRLLIYLDLGIKKDIASLNVGANF